MIDAVITAGGVDTKIKRDVRRPRGTTRKPVRGTTIRLAGIPHGEHRLKYRATSGAVPSVAERVTVSTAITCNARA